MYFSKGLLGRMISDLQLGSARLLAFNDTFVFSTVFWVMISMVDGPDRLVRNIDHEKAS